MYNYLSVFRPITNQEIKQFLIQKWRLFQAAVTNAHCFFLTFMEMPRNGQSSVRTSAVTSDYSDL